MESKTIKVSTALSILLLIAGIVLVTLGAYLWLAVDTAQPASSVSERTATTTVNPGPGNKAKRKTTRVFATKTTTTVQAAESERSRRSETLVGMLIVLGSLLLLLGAFYDRISEFSLPGGPAVKLLPLPSPKTQATIAGVLAASPELTEQPKLAEVAYLAAISEAQSRIYDQVVEAEAEGAAPPAPTLPRSEVHALTERKIRQVLGEEK